MTQKAKSENNAKASPKKFDVKAPAKATRVAVARRLAGNHNETLLTSAVISQR